MKYWIKERHNGQTKRYFVGCGKLSKKTAKDYENTLAGHNIMHAFDTEADYSKRLAELKESGELL